MIGGGPSVASQNIEALRGHRVIAVNSSWVLAPFADIVFFGDGRWWRAESECSRRLHRGLPEPAAQYGELLLASGYVGRIVTCAESVHDRAPILKLHKMRLPGLSTDPRSVVMRRTSMTAAINLAVHLGVKSIVLLGLDGKPAIDGRTHHHEHHPWDQRTNCWMEQLEDLASIVRPLLNLGIEVINANPDSAVKLWPIVPLQDCLS